MNETSPLACERAVLDQLDEMQRHAAGQSRRDGRLAEDEAFYAEQNARLVKNAEQYYRSMFYSNVKSWNLRDQHMSDTLSALAQHLSRRRARKDCRVGTQLAPGRCAGHRDR